MARDRPQDPESDGGIGAATRCGVDALRSPADRLLVTDLDGTFIGDDRATIDLWDALDAADIGVAFATGRHLAAVEEFQRSVGRRALACVCMVGTEIWLRRFRGYRLDRGWSTVISAFWDRAAVLAAARVVPGLTLQHEEWQSPFKISWFIDSDDAEAIVARVERVLESRELSALLIHSGGHLLDAVPIESGKGSATAFLARRLELPSSAIVTAGDSGNDLDMMRPDLGFRSIIVGNAAPDLAGITGDHLYRATASHAAGIREGLERFGWL